MNLKYGNQCYSVESTMTADEISSVVDSEKLSIKTKKITDNAFNIYFDNKYMNVYSARDGKKIYVIIDEHPFTFEIADDEEKSFGGESGANADKEILKPPMPGSIVKVIVEKGQKVSDGDALIIIEAMKMETTLYATINGIVTEINAAEGEQVDADKVLMIIEKEKE